MDSIKEQIIRKILREEIANWRLFYTRPESQKSVKEESRLTARRNLALRILEILDSD